jgi:hypothetical protein
MLVHRSSRYHRAVPPTTALRAAPERALRSFPPLAVAAPVPRPAGDALAGYPGDGRAVRRGRVARRGARRAGAPPRRRTADDRRRARRGVASRRTRSPARTSTSRCSTRSPPRGLDRTSASS